MTAAIAAPSPSPAAAPAPAAPTPAPRAVPPFPTAAALALARATRAELELVMVRGETPDLEALVGWEFRGINRPAWARLAGIKKFVKGFFRGEDGRVMGYNSPVVQNVLDGRWRTRPSDTAPKRFGFYEVAPVDATRRDNTYLHAVLLDYGRGGNHRLDPTSGLRDYLVQVDPANPDLFLGKAYYALGPVRVSSNFFILERFRRGLTDYARR
jgi:hypothetical protein